MIAPGLRLTPERAQAVAAILASWVPAADALSLKMSAAEHAELLPITVFAQPRRP